jgi:hypothetical protein
MIGYKIREMADISKKNQQPVLFLKPGLRKKPLGRNKP